MTDVQLKVIARAARIRVGRGMSLDEVLSHWPSLTDEDKAKVRVMLDVLEGGDGVA